MVLIPFELLVTLLEAVGGAVAIDSYDMMSSSPDSAPTVTCETQRDPWRVIYRLHGQTDQPDDISPRIFTPPRRPR